MAGSPVSRVHGPGVATRQRGGDHVLEKKNRKKRQRLNVVRTVLFDTRDTQCCARMIKNVKM